MTAAIPLRSPAPETRAPLAGHTMKRLLLAALSAFAIASPAVAQVDLSGEWGVRFHEDNPERGTGPDLGEYYGIPLSDAARWRGETWNGAVMTENEWQCRPHGADYIWRGPSALMISKKIDPTSRDVTEFDLEWLRSIERPVYLDNRPSPSPNAPHTWAGFSKAKWVGDMLMVQTTHLKESYLRRNGLPRSDVATLTEYLIRNNDVLTAVALMHDPVYLTETFIRSTDYELDLKQHIPPYPCHVVEEIDRPVGQVPHNKMNSDKSQEEFAAKWGIPVDQVRGGAKTMYLPGAVVNPTKGQTGASTKQGVPIDITGTWMAVVTEDWRWRMVTPPKGAFDSVPLNAAGQAVVKAWDPAKDTADGNQCKAWGAAGVMRRPGQIRISWADDRTMKVETEAGTQTRNFLFGPGGGPPSPAASLQGVSRANWQLAGRPARGAAPPPGGSLRVITTNLAPGYLRTNGVPYSANTRVTEYYNRIDDPEGASWLIVTTVVEDPTYINGRFITSSNFRKMVDTNPWNPTPCVTPPPTVKTAASESGGGG